MLYALVPGFIGDYQYDVTINITTGYIDIGDIVYESPRSGPTLWETGIPDRSAAEFYIPDPNPKFINKLYVNHPDRSVHFLTLVGLCSMVYGKYQGPTWQIKFGLDNVNQTKTYTLQIALATATVTELPIHVNDSRADSPLVSYMCDYIRLEGPSSSTST
ncbi:hypothetical protein M0R45_027173 [Rubus argutus]|uniref:Rhamnogalacturonan lyase domain-containing protein n=1 Tax=Rubus argutus TaxID=59490 RepID=A0AAW1X2D2_RUBAR